MLQIASFHISILDLHTKRTIFFSRQDVDSMHNALKSCCMKRCPLSLEHVVMPGEAFKFCCVFLSAFSNFLSKWFRQIPVKGPVFKKFNTSQISFLLCRFPLRNISLPFGFRLDPFREHGISRSNIRPADRNRQSRFAAYQMNPRFGPCDSRIVNIPP